MNDTKNKFDTVRTRAAAIGTAALVAAGNAAAFDSATVITKIEDNALLGVAIVGAMILAVWGLRSMGLLKGRG